MFYFYFSHAHARVHISLLVANAGLMLTRMHTHHTCLQRTTGSVCTTYYLFYTVPEHYVLLLSPRDTQSKTGAFVV